MKKMEQFVTEAKKDLKQYVTQDFQKRGGRYPKDGVPDSISNYKNELIFEFKNTSERDAKRWVERWLKNQKLKGKVTTSQSGDYDDDWVQARASIR